MTTANTWRTSPGIVSENFDNGRIVLAKCSGKEGCWNLLIITPLVRGGSIRNTLEAGPVEDAKQLALDILNKIVLS